MIVGHKKQWQYLNGLAEAGKIPHALLFCGQEGLGKRKAAIEFIKLLNCSAPDRKDKPCQSCRSCREIEKKIYPDLKIIEPPAFIQKKAGGEKGRDKEIQISQIRELEHFLSLRPFSSVIKAAVIDRCHLMTRESQSCILKTLEEPKGAALLILLSEYPRTLLPTVTSRVEKLAFFPVSPSDIEKYLRSQDIPEVKRKEIIRRSSGSPGRAIDFARNPEKLEACTQIARQITKIFSLDYASRFQYARELAQTPAKASETLELWLGHFRNLLSSQDLTPGAKPCNPAKTAGIIKKIDKILFLTSTTNVNLSLALELLMLEL